MQGAGTIDHEQHPAYALQSWTKNAPNEQVIVLHDLVSHPNHRNVGIGKIFVEYVIDFARRYNAVTI